MQLPWILLKLFWMFLWSQGATQVSLAFSLQCEAEMGEAINFIAPDEKTFSMWTDGINALLGNPVSSTNFSSIIPTSSVLFFLADDQWADQSRAGHSSQHGDQAAFTGDRGNHHSWEPTTDSSPSPELWFLLQKHMILLFISISLFSKETFSQGLVSCRSLLYQRILILDIRVLFSHGIQTVEILMYTSIIVCMFWSFPSLNSVATNHTKQWLSPLWSKISAVLWGHQRMYLKFFNLPI